MAYRKIEVFGKMWEYVIGQKHVKVRGLGAFPVSEVGKERLSNTPVEGSFGETYGSIYGETKFITLPDDVRKLIGRNHAVH